MGGFVRPARRSPSDRSRSSTSTASDLVACSTATLAPAPMPLKTAVGCVRDSVRDGAGRPVCGAALLFCQPFLYLRSGRGRAIVELWRSAGTNIWAAVTATIRTAICAATVNAAAGGLIVLGLTPGKALAVRELGVLRK